MTHACVYRPHVSFPFSNISKIVLPVAEGGRVGKGDDDGDFKRPDKMTDCCVINRGCLIVTSLPYTRVNP